MERKKEKRKGLLYYRNVLLYTTYDLSYNAYVGFQSAYGTYSLLAYFIDLVCQRTTRKSLTQLNNTISFQEWPLKPHPLHLTSAFFIFQKAAAAQKPKIKKVTPSTFKKILHSTSYYTTREKENVHNYDHYDTVTTIKHRILLHDSSAYIILYWKIYHFQTVRDCYKRLYSKNRMEVSPELMTRARLFCFL